MQINAAFVEIIGDRVNAFALELLVLISVIFFAVACAVHKGWAGAVVQALGENTRVDIHQRVAAFAVRHLAEWTDRIAVDIGNNAEPGRLAAAGKTLYASVAVWYVDVDELAASAISDRCATGSRWAAVGVEDVSWVDVWIHTHRLRRCHEHRLALDDDDFRFVISKDEADGAHCAALIIRQNVVDVELVHDFGAVFAGFVREHALLVGAIVFQMVALTGWHRVPFEVVLAGWLHIDAPFFPALYNAFGAAHHLA